MKAARRAWIVAWVAAMVGLASPSSVCADDPVQVRAITPMPIPATPSRDAPAVLRATFTQERHLAGFRHPLRSEGEVLLVRGVGLRWQTRKPFPSTLIVRDGRMSFRDGEGRSQDIVDGGHVAGLVQELLAALLSSDRAALATRFILRDRPPVREGGWALTLEPRDAPLTALYSRIDLGGEVHVEHLVLHERSGSRTTIHFLDTRIQAEAGAVERRELD